MEQNQVLSWAVAILAIVIVLYFMGVIPGMKSKFGVDTGDGGSSGGPPPSRYDNITTTSPTETPYPNYLATSIGEPVKSSFAVGYTPTVGTVYASSSHFTPGLPQGATVDTL